MERATVKRHLKGVIKVREGRGYSLAELREVSLDYFKALQKNIPVDRFRNSKHEENVRRLEVFLKKAA